MLHSNEIIATQRQHELWRMAQQQRLAREAKTKPHAPLYARTVSVLKSLWETLGRRGNNRRTAPSLNTRRVG